MGKDVDPKTDIFAVGIILWELLAGQRLFLGETDFQTVKKVQQAVVPPISQVNRKAPPELERIVNKALARDMLHRYQTARELGQDLSRFLYAYGQPISTFDVATIVQSTMREKQRVRQPQGSIIDKLIEEALFEFTSLKEDGAQSEGAIKVGAAAPLNPGQFVDTTNWAEEINIQEKRPGQGFDPIRNALPGEVFDGNLSALEDVPVPPSGQVPPSSHQLPQHVMTPGMPQQPMPLPQQQQHPGAQGTSKGMGATGPLIGVVVALVVAAAGAAAWFTGLIHH